ncbi:unnamed protein product [Phytophthora lilii]|uniref:Unnamed protein product n=1 Tax=Phytophthora lilii TaxID=2077276 RepID=A0A9W6THT8_9STRA|nr:unnamed protein product [Phytophthora lilii]
MSPRKQFGDSTTQHSFEAVAGVLARELNAVGEGATRCLCGLLYPVDFDGVSVPGAGTILEHATRIRPFFKNFLADTVTKMDGSTRFATFSPLFLMLQSACQLTRDAHEKASYTQLGDDFAPYIASIYEAVEDAFQGIARDDWILRKRGLELLTMLLDIFALQDSAWCTSVEMARQYFQSHLERVRALVLAGRRDSVSLVREAAIPAAIAFEYFEKLYPQTSGMNFSVISSYDFVPPIPPGYSLGSTRWAKPVATTSSHHAGVPAAPARSISSESIEEKHTPDFSGLTTGDEALPSQDDEAPAFNVPAHTIFTRNRSFGQSSKVAARDLKPLQTTEPTEESDRFIEMAMDQAEPEHGDEVSCPQSDDESSSTEHAQVKEPISVKLTPSAAQINIPTLSRPRLKTVTNLKQFAVQQRAQVRSRQAQHQHIPHTVIPKRQPLRSIRLSEATENGSDFHSNDIRDMEKDVGNSQTKLTRDAVTLEAARSGDYELAIRLCILEDDLLLLRRTMTIIGTPCLAMLSSMARNALCTAFLSLLDGSEAEDTSDVWLALQWLQSWAADKQQDRQQIDELLDPRVAEQLCAKLHEMTVASTKSALAAAHVLVLFGLRDAEDDQRRRRVFGFGSFT